MGAGLENELFAFGMAPMPEPLGREPRAVGDDHVDVGVGLLERLEVLHAVGTDLNVGVGLAHQLAQGQTQFELADPRPYVSTTPCASK